MKNKFVKSTIILVIGALLTKIMAMVIRIILTRTVGTEGIGLYMLILPTFNLFITLASLGLPISISKLVSEEKKNNKKLVLSIIPVMLFFNIFLMLLLFLIAPFISNYLLSNPKTYYPLMAIGLTLPFITLSDIIRGYFFGKQKMFPHTLSNNFEQIVRLILIILIIPNLLNYSLEIAITGVVLINIISEFASILVLLLFLPKNVKISKKDFYYDKENIRDVLNISIPTTSSRLIGSLSFFLEPIILTFTLTLIGYSNDFITFEYGVINGYVIPLLTIPSFFTLAVSNALLPVVSNSYVNKKYSYIKGKIKQAILFSLLIGIPVTLIFMICPEILLKFMYNTTYGIEYIKVLAPIFLLHYIQSPLTSSLQAMGKSKCAMFGTLIGSIIRIVLLFITSLFKIGMWGIVIASAINIIYVTIHHLIYIRKYLKKV